MSQLAPRTGRYRAVIALLLFIVSIINYLDRAALGVVAPFITQELGLSPSELGLLFSTFFVGYAVFAFIGGQLADRYGPHRVLSWAAGSWSIFCALTGAVTGFIQLFIVRSLFGFAEGPITSVTNRTITNWFPREEISRAVGFIFSGLMVGGVLAAPVVGFLALTYGWRMAFFVIGAAGLVWVLAWWHFATDRPQENPYVGNAESELIAAGRPSSAIPLRDRSLPLRAFLWRSSTLSLGLGLFAMNYTVFILLSWLPSYLTSELHMDARRMSWVAAIPWAGGFVGFVVGGLIADAAYARLSNRLMARKLMTVVPLVFAAAMLIGVNFSSGAVSAVALMTATLMLLMCSMQSLWATTHELVPQTHMGGVSGFIHLLSTISGIIGPAATGFAIQYFGGYDSAFYIAASLAIVGALAMALYVKGPGRIVELATALSSRDST